MKISIPNYVEIVLNTLHRNGYEAFLVGGCVRDACMGLEPHDWDITTSALPDEMMNSFSSFKIIETGLKHGTLTVMSEKQAVEVTTYRVDGEYSDGRHPDSVHFTTSLKEDLARRDFTVNTLAYNSKDGLIDYFGGQDDLNHSLLRCVGKPDERFHEDALRILRALRFSSTLNFEIDSATEQSIEKNKFLLEQISKERIASELSRLLCGENAGNVLRKFPNVIAQFLPEILPSIGFEQHNPHHLYDVWEHTLHTLMAIRPKPILRLTMLFHDLGKPACFSKGVDGIGHFYKHSVQSKEIAETALKRLKYSNEIIDRVSLLVSCHDMQTPKTFPKVKRWLNRFGEAFLRDFLEVCRADDAGKNQDFHPRATRINKFEEILNTILDENQCFQIKDLTINGKDLINLGITDGKTIGKALNFLLTAVINETHENDKKELLALAQKEFLE